RAALALSRLATGREKKLRALQLLELSTKSSPRPELLEALSRRAELSSELRLPEALDHAGRDLLTLDPALLASKQLAPALTRSARREFGALTVSERLAICRRLLSDSEPALALALSGEIAEKELSEADRPAVRLVRAQGLMKAGKSRAGLHEAAQIA